MLICFCYAISQETTAPSPSQATWAHWPSLSSISVALSQTPAYTVRPRARASASKSVSVFFPAKVVRYFIGQGRMEVNCYATPPADLNVDIIQVVLSACVVCELKHFNLLLFTPVLVQLQCRHLPHLIYELLHCL